MPMHASHFAGLPPLLSPMKFLLGLCLTVVLLACNTDDETTHEPYLHTVVVQKIERVDSYQSIRSLPGRVEAPQRVDIGFDAQGEVIAVLVNAGDKVIKGQLLAELDTSLLNAESRSNRGREQETTARMKLVDLELKRQLKLQRQGFSAEQKIDELTAEKETLNAQMEQIFAASETIDQRLRKSKLLAPFAGRVANRFVDQGSVIQAGSPVVRLLESGSIELHVGVPLLLARNLTVGSTHTVRVEQHKVVAPILSINSALSPSTQTVIVEMSLPPKIENNVLVDGQIARLELSENQPDSGAWVPSVSLVGGVRGTWALYALEPNDESSLQSKDTAANVSTEKTFTVVKRVATVLYMLGDRAFIQGEFQTGEKIVAAGVHRLAAGQRVKVQ